MSLYGDTPGKSHKIRGGFNMNIYGTKKLGEVVQDLGRNKHLCHTKFCFCGYACCESQVKRISKKSSGCC